MTSETPFPWFDLVTPTPAAHVAALASALGVQPPAFDPDAGFQVVSFGAFRLGMVHAREEVTTRAHWLAHVVTDEVEAFCRRVAFLQGDVIEPPAGPEGTALIEDPGGVTLAAARTSPDSGAPWASLVGGRADLGVRVYRALLDLRDAETVDTPVGPYRVLKQRTRRVAGVLGASDVEAQWVPHLPVADLAAGLASSPVLMPPTAVRKTGRVCLLRLADGLPVGLIAPE